MRRGCAPGRAAQVGAAWAPFCQAKRSARSCQPPLVQAADSEGDRWASRLKSPASRMGTSPRAASSARAAKRAASAACASSTGAYREATCKKERPLPQGMVAWHHRPASHRRRTASVAGGIGRMGVPERTATAHPPAWADHIVGEEPAARVMRGMGLPQAMVHPCSSRARVMWRWAPSPMRVSCSARMWPGRRVTTSSCESNDVMFAEVIRRLPGGSLGGLPGWPGR